SRNAVAVWDITPPPPPKKEKDKEPIDPKKGTLPMISMGEPAGPKPIPVVFEDTLGADPLKIGTVTGDGRRAYLSSSEGARVTVNSHAFSNRQGADTSDELKSVFTP